MAYVVEVWLDPANRRQEVHVDGQLVSTGTEAEHTWTGLHLQSTTAEQLARALGLEFQYRKFHDEEES